ncbi:trypsin-like peptidase domain-containing protein [Aquimarina sp. I32.4]|uniref:trypsin-like peptidase domain-containing protein n=1 Tax=Aquimarina sp. I32.4 TaxID=2053903 RepID=UPI000CDEC9A8|nr:trypsin-like peptidase domain-containing protein [Aquimarina sp. I32.4]
MNYTHTNITQVNCRYPISQKYVLICLAFLFISYTGFAQDELPRHYTEYDIQIRSDSGQGKNSSQVITRTISEKGATWLRLFLKDVNLGNKSTLTITSVLDGATQTLNSKTIKDWKNTTAYFNGDEVILKLIIASGESSIGIGIKELGVGEKHQGSKTQCGSTDDRVDSADNAIGRIVPIGCTGWIITNGRLVTAGHCARSRAQLIEFNVPKSNPDRTIVHPGPEDQYPIGNFVTPYSSSASPANDWAVFTASANSQTGQTPIQAQGKSFNVVQSAPGNNITITGYGTDTGIDNQTQQIHTGPLSSVDNTFVRYITDTTGGNSGSPIIDTATGNAVGVHAYGGCSGSGGANYGGRATIPAFWDAMGLDGNPPPPPPCTIIDFNDFQITPFSNQDGTGDFSVQSGGNSLSLQNNTWKYISMNYNVTANTVIEFQFSSSSQGEIHAVGFENDNALTPSRYFRVYGTQNYGVGNYDNYSGSGTKTYTIPVGNFYTGAMDRLVFINDNDVGSGNSSIFSNVKIYEGSCGQSATSEDLIAELESVTPILGKDNESDLSGLKISPNPTQDSFSLNVNPQVKGTVTATIYTILGSKKGKIELQPGINTISTRSLSLGVGIYLIKIDNGEESTTKKLIVN